MNQNETFKYAHDYLNKLREQNRDFVIDGDTDEIGGISLNFIMDMDFGENLADELIVIHATDYSPSKNYAIVSTESTFKTVHNLAGTHDSHRITVHTTLNSLVQSNNGGDWEYRLYTVLEPFSNINSRVCGFGVSDTFFYDKVDLSKQGIILVREEDKTKLSETDKEMNIVYFRGSPRNAVNKAMIMMGYKPQTLNIDDIKNEKNNQRLHDFRINQRYGPSRHSMTVYSLIESRLGMRDIILTELRGRNVNTCIDSTVSLDEISEIIARQRLANFFSDKMDLVRIFLEMGISFNENGPFLLNTAQTINRISKYYDHESYKMIVTEETINNYPEIVGLLNQYQSYIDQKVQERQIDESYEAALNTNNIFNSLPQEIDHNAFGFNEDIRQYIADLKKIFKGVPFDIKITETGVILIAPEEEIFTVDLFPEKTTDEKLDALGVDNIKIDFDFQKSLIENLKEVPQKISQICQKLDQKDKTKIGQMEEGMNSAFHM